MQKQSMILFLGIFLAVSFFLAINCQPIQAGLRGNPYLEKAIPEQAQASQNSPKIATKSPNTGLLSRAKAKVAQIIDRGVEWLKNKVWGRMKAFLKQKKEAIVRGVNQQKEKMMEKIKATILGSIEEKATDIWQKIKDIL